MAVSDPLLPRVIAHRGASQRAPENTLAAIRATARLGTRAIELDAKLTADGVPVLMHDDTVDRTTNGRGAMATLTLAEVRTLDAGRWFDPAFAGESVPTLEEAIALCRALGLGANIEIKPCPGRDEETGTVVAATVARAWPAADPGDPRPTLSSFSETALRAAAAVAGDIPRALLVWEVPADWRERLLATGVRILHCEHSKLDKATARAIKAAGIALRCYTVNDPGRAARLFAWGVDALISDAPERLYAVVPRRK